MSFAVTVEASVAPTTWRAGCGVGALTTDPGVPHPASDSVTRTATKALSLRTCTMVT